MEGKSDRILPGCVWPQVLAFRGKWTNRESAETTPAIHPVIDALIIRRKNPEERRAKDSQVPEPDVFHGVRVCSWREGDIYPLWFQPRLFDLSLQCIWALRPDASGASVRVTGRLSAERCGVR